MELQGPIHPRIKKPEDDPENPEDKPEEEETRDTGPRTVLLHALQELDNDLGRRADHYLALAALLGVVDALESIA